MTWQLALHEGLRCKDAGLDSLERHDGFLDGFLTQARALARLICQECGTVTIDDLRDVISRPTYIHCNVWGAILRAPRFVPTGEFVATRRPEGHARRIQVWRLAKP